MIINKVNAYIENLSYSEVREIVQNCELNSEKLRNGIVIEDCRLKTAGNEILRKDYPSSKVNDEWCELFKGSNAWFELLRSIAAWAYRRLALEEMKNRDFKQVGP